MNRELLEQQLSELPLYTYFYTKKEPGVPSPPGSEYCLDQIKNNIKLSLSVVCSLSAFHPLIIA